MIKLSVLLSVTLLAICVSAYKKGAPNLACAELEPKHKDWKGQTTPSPFKIEAKKNGEIVEVTITGTETDKFKGFLLVGRDAKNKNVGEWEQVEKAKLLKCDNDNDAITHESNVEKESITLKWKIPKDYKGTVCFKGAVVKNGRTFWVGQKSNPVEI